MKNEMGAVACHPAKVEDVSRGWSLSKGKKGMKDNGGTSS